LLVQIGHFLMRTFNLTVFASSYVGHMMEILWVVSHYLKVLLTVIVLAKYTYKIGVCIVLYMFVTDNILISRTS